MFLFIKKMFIELLSICAIGRFGSPLASNYKKPIKCVSLSNQSCQTRSTLVNINSDETLFYAFTISVNKCCGSFKTVNVPYARACGPNKVFKLMSGVNETRVIVPHESCKCKCGSNESVCNSKQKWNPDECLRECKELDDWGSCKGDYM